MNDVSAAAGQLARLRERLEQKESEYRHLVVLTDEERNRNIQFMTRLMQACRGHDRELDNKLARLHQRFDERIPLPALVEDIQAAEKLLQQHANLLEESLRVSRESIREGGRLLTTTKEVPDKIRKEVRDFLTQASPYALAEHQQQVTRLLELYQQAVRSLLLRPVKLNDQVELSDHVLLRNKLCDELQRLITELDFTGPVGEKLAEIRAQLLHGVALEALPQLCLGLIELIIEGARQERRESHLFLTSLNDSISSVHLRLNESLDEGRAMHEQHQRAGDEIHRHLDSIGQQLELSPPYEQLKQNIGQSLSVLQTLLLERNQLLAREQRFLHDMAAMEQKINLMKEETSEYKKRIAQQKHKLLLDSLTQVFNRATFDERLDLEYKRWLRYQAPLCLAIIDIDHFKSINDRFGHLAGDKALKVIARAMSRTLRETDFIARYGGDEFVVLLPGVDASNSLTPLEKLRNVVKSIPFRFKDDRVEITISIGMTLFRNGDSAMEAFERADQALYEAKNDGRDRIVQHV